MRKLQLFICAGAILSMLASCQNGNNNQNSSTIPTSSIDNSLKGRAKFLKAQENTLNSASYQYSFDLTASLSFDLSGVTGSGKVASLSGATYYNSKNSSTQYLQKKTTKAGLLFESTSYIYNQGTELIKVNENSNKYSIESKQGAKDFDHKNYSFNKLINNLSEKTLDEGKDLSTGKYRLDYKLSYRLPIFNDIAGSIDVDYFVKLVNKYQNTVDIAYDSYVTYNGEYFDTYYLKFDITIKDVATISLTYTQKYSNIGKNISFSLPSLNNQHISQTDINEDLTEIKNSISSFKEKASSSYDYKVKTAVDHGPSKSNPFGCAVNSTSKGDAKRGLLDNKVYFNNDLEVDSDYKNKDQYTSDCIKDYHVYRAKLNDGNDTVRDEIVKTLKNSFADAKDSSSLDEYYFLYDDFLSSDYVSVSSKEINAKNTEITYTLGLNNAGSKKLLSAYNSSIRLNGSYDVKEENNPGHVDIYQISDSFSTKKSEVKIIIDKESKDIKSIETNIKGYYEAISSSVKSEGANTFVKFELDSTLKNFDVTATYKIPTIDKDIR